MPATPTERVSAVDACHHEACACAPADGSAYCGAYCANAQETESLPGDGDFAGSCSCGHAACGAEREPEPAGREVVTSTGRE